MSSRPKNLVIVCAGDDTLHDEYTKPKNRNYDVMVFHYSDKFNFESYGEYYFRQTGYYYQMLWEQRHYVLPIASKYEYISVLSDDVFITKNNMEKIFFEMRDLEADLGQPSLSEDSYHSWKITLNQPGLRARRVTKVEGMCPCFSLITFSAIFEVFSVNRTSWGIESAWIAVLERKLGRYPRAMIFDSVIVENKIRPIGEGDLYDGLTEEDKQQSFDSCIKKYNVPKKIYDNHEIFEKIPLIGSSVNYIV